MEIPGAKAQICKMRGEIDWPSVPVNFGEKKLLQNRRVNMHKQNCNE